MEFFADGLLVRLRSRASGFYLHADEDGVSVAVSPHRASEKAVWEVCRFRREGTGDCIVLRARSSGRYLAAESADQAPRSRRAAVVQRDYEQGFFAFAWRATRAGRSWEPDGDHVLLRDRSNRHLFAADDDAEPEPEARGVVVYVEKSYRRNNPELHWRVLAVLSLGGLRPAPPPPAPAAAGFQGDDAPSSVARFFVPRLCARRTSAHLPVVGPRNRFLGYIPASAVAGLQALIHGTCGGDDVLTADADAISGGGEASVGEMVVTVLAFLAGGGRGIRSLPLHLEGGRCSSEGSPNADADTDAAAAAADEAAEEGVEAAAQEADAALLLGAHEAEEGHADAAQQQARDEDEQREQEQEQARVVVAENRIMIDEARFSLANAYTTMESKHQLVSRLVEQGRRVGEEAAARRDWTGVDRTQRRLRRSILQAIVVYDETAAQAAALRDTLVRLGDERPPSPPPLLRRHPGHLI